MRDFIRFLVRGGLGGAMGGATFALLIFMYYFGPSWEQMYLFHPLVLACFAVPGVIAGLALWTVTTLVGARLTIILRIPVGAGVVLTTFLVCLFSVLRGANQIDLKQVLFSAPFMWLLVWLAVTGGIAGFLSPAQKLFTKQAGLTYWDRVALYEIAEREASLARTRHAQSIVG